MLSDTNLGHRVVRQWKSLLTMVVSLPSVMLEENKGVIHSWKMYLIFFAEFAVISLTSLITHQSHSTTQP